MTMGVPVNQGKDGMATLSSSQQAGDARLELKNSQDDESKKRNELVSQGKDGAGAKAARRDSLVADPSRAVGPEEQTSRSQPSTSKSQGGTGQAGKSVHLAQVEPSASAHISGQDQGRPPSAVIDSHPNHSSGYCGAKESRKEATSTQAVKRGHSVELVEVPNEEDNSSYQQWCATGSPMITPKRSDIVLPTPLTQAPTKPIKEVTLPMKAQEVPQGWLKPSSSEWLLRNIHIAQTNNAAQAHLAMWIHNKHYGELTDKLLLELRAQEWEYAKECLYELREPIRYICGASGDFMLLVTLNPCTGRQTLSTKVLLDSGCTGRTINKAYINKHGLNTKKAVVPILVYNANGTHNQGGDITEFVELQMTIGEHRERIDLAVTDLGKKDLYLRHDWLKRHNPMMNL